MALKGLKRSACKAWPDIPLQPLSTGYISAFSGTLQLEEGSVLVCPCAIWQEVARQRMACKGQAAPSLQQMTVDLHLRCSTNSSAQFPMSAGHFRCMTPCCDACSAEAVAEANSTAFLLVDVATPRWKILFCNSAFTELTELDFDAVRGVPLWDLFVTEVGVPQFDLEQCRDRFCRARGVHNLC